MTNEEYFRQRQISKHLGRSDEEESGILRIFGITDDQAHEIFMDITAEQNPGWLNQYHRYTRYEPFIYFIQEGFYGPIKIGLSGDPYKRISQLQTAQAKQLRFLLIFPGDRRVEKWLHEKCERICLGGEWFHNCPGLQRLISNLRFLFDPEAANDYVI